MKPQRLEIKWPVDRLLLALYKVIDEQPFSRVRRQFMKKRLAKLVRQNRFEIGNVDTEWLHRMCRASLMLHDYHWFAWEWRSEFAHTLATQPWCWPQWDGSRARILVVAEQGIGDEIVFATCYHELAADVEEAWIEVDPRLIPIFERSFPENLHFVDRFVHAGKGIIPRLTDYPKLREGLPIEAFILAGNVPKLYRQSVQDFPREKGFLVASSLLVGKWIDWLQDSDAPLVGWSWKGRQGEIVPAEHGISLQYGVTDHKGLHVPPIDLKRDLENVFALLKAIEFDGGVRGGVVTTTNAVAHMAGALGVPTDVIKPPPIFATKEDAFNNRVSSWWPDDWTDWYPSVKMYRNQQAWRAKQ